MSAGEELVTPFASWEGVMALLGALGLGGVLTALVQRPSRRAVEAAADRDEATGEAAVINAMAGAFTGTMGGMREEIDRLQEMLNELRNRVVEAEAEIRAAGAREAGLERVVHDLRVQLDTAQGDVLRLRLERDAARGLGVQQEGEIRQLKAVIDAHQRVTT